MHHWRDASATRAKQIVPDANVPLARSMDELGNWVGDPADPTEPGLARRDDFDGSGFSPPDAWVDGWHAVNSANQITETTTDDGSGPVTTAYVHDAAGNLIFDGRLLYLYDGCNRLVQVNEAGGLTVADFAGAGYFEEIETAPVGPVLARFVYDGLGRLIRTERWDTYQNYESEAFYYDGVRRLVEVDAADANAPVLREYVWGPDYVDEAVCQFADEDGNPATPATVHFYLQDGNYNVVALVDAAGGLAAQYAYEPYGLLVVVDLDPNAPVNRLGHQGLFFERFYGPFGGPPAPPLSAPALVAADPAAGVPAGLYHNRNRWYSPDLGRFVQRDMNESALPILAVLAMNGAALDAFLSGFEPVGHYGDGLNLYLYAGANPLTRRDALGLSWGYDDEIDDLIADRNGNALAAVGIIHEGAKFAALGMGAALKVAAALLPGAGLIDLYGSGSAILSGDAGFWDYVAVVGVASPAVYKALKWGGKMFKASRFGGKLRSSFARWFGRGGPCNCFVAGTLIETPNGPVPIESIEQGDIVFTRAQEEPSAPIVCGEVTRVFRNVTSLIMWVTMASGQVLGMTPTHRVWTVEQEWMYAGALVAGDTFTTIDGEIAAVESVALDWTTTETYNFEVDGTFTYFADRVWVHNDSCDLVQHLHHVLPKFLKGAEDGIRVPVTAGDHVGKGGYHSGLIMALTDAGIRRGTGTWKKYLELYPDKLTDAYGVLMNYTRAYDAKHGTNLVSSIWEQVTIQMRNWH